MILPFLEERLPIDVRYGSSYSDGYNVKIVETSSDSEDRTLVHPFPKYRFAIRYLRKGSVLWGKLVSLYHRCYGRYAGFRVYHHDDNSTNGETDPPTATDQDLALVSTGIYQLQKEYGLNGTAIAIGRPVRTIFKPVSGTVLVAMSNTTSGDFTTTDFTVDTTTGKVTLAADKTRAVTAITQAAEAVLTVGTNTFLVGESVHVGDVVGMTEINGLRGEILAKPSTTTIRVDIDSTAFTAYSSGGNVHTRPQTGESVKGGCLFDIPCRFDSDIDITPVSPDQRETGDIFLVEILNP